ncbi:NUDIX hydrolase [Bacillus sp. FJAT-49732]|uniref:NUDIX hydrolase n=1 Tax=Lederbergia citrisecunda TaxID=2833583 RepID=A0A942YP30_9BACI|nr:NUDIX hydrolase [Lederbergia citrisecunda]MBS4200901.1 NUDIX hydrolase [Lederbergia citrisecunda]
MDYIKHLRSMVGHEKVIMVVAGAFVFDEENRVLMQKRSDNGQWGFPGGFMELGESVQDTAKREVYEETGLQLEKLELFGIYSGSEYDKTFANGDQVSLVQVVFICRQYKGNLVVSNEESIQNKFFALEKLPQNIFTDHKIFVTDLLAKKQLPIIG